MRPKPYIALTTCLGESADGPEPKNLCGVPKEKKGDGPTLSNRREGCEG